MVEKRNPKTTLFLKVATALAILGLIARLFLSVLHQVLLNSSFISPGYLVYRVLGVLEEIAIDFPLIIFFIAFFLSLLQGRGGGQKQPQEQSAE